MSSMNLFTHISVKGKYHILVCEYFLALCSSLPKVVESEVVKLLNPFLIIISTLSKMGCYNIPLSGVRSH